MVRNVLFAVLLAGIAGIAQADVYRWVDAQGGVHYSDQWVEGSQLIKVDKRHTADAVPSTSTANGVAATGARIESDLAQKDAARAVQADVAKEQDKQCKEAKERYELAIQSRRVFRTGKDGEKEYLTDDEADAYRLTARTDMETACKTAK